MTGRAVCLACHHYWHETLCYKCGCKDNTSRVQNDQSMVKLEGPSLERLLNALQRSDIRYVRISWHGDTIKVKVNEGGWSPPMGIIQPPY